MVWLIRLPHVVTIVYKDQFRDAYNRSHQKGFVGKWSSTILWLKCSTATPAHALLWQSCPAVPAWVRMKIPTVFWSLLTLPEQYGHGSMVPPFILFNSWHILTCMSCICISSLIWESQLACYHYCIKLLYPSSNGTWGFYHSTCPSLQSHLLFIGHSKPLMNEHQWD